MSASVSNRNDWGASGEDTRHVIDSAIFGLTFPNGNSRWPDELELARIVETELMPVVNEVFDERSPTSGVVRIDKLEIDLGSLVFDGSWTDLRERLREGVYTALLRAEELSIDAQGSKTDALPSGFLPASGFDLLAHFLRFGMLPRHAQIRDPRSMAALLRDLARAEPQRLAILIRDDAVAAARLVRQFPDALVRQVVAALGSEYAPVMLQPGSQAVDPCAGEALPGHLAELSSPPRLDQILSELEQRQPKSLDWLFDKLRSGKVALASLVDQLSTAGHRRLLAGIVAAASRHTGTALELQQTITAQAQRVDNERDFYRQLLERLVSNQLIDVEAIAARSPMSDGQEASRQTRERNRVSGSREPMLPLPGSERLFRAYDLNAKLVESAGEAAGEQQIEWGETIDELARDHPQQFERIMLELRSGVLRLPQIAARLTGAGLRRLVHAFVMSMGSADADCRRFLQSIDDHARRAGSERAFYIQLLQRLVDRELVDLEEIASGAVVSAEQDVFEQNARREGRARSPGAASAEPDDGETAQLLRDYLRDGVVLPDRILAVLRRAAGRLLAAEPQRFAGLLRQSLKGEKAIARLVGLLPERLLTRILYLLAPADYERIQLYADAIANLCGTGQGGIASARVTELKWQFCFQYLLKAAPQWNADLFVQRFAGFLRQSLKSDKELARLAGIDRQGAGVPVSPAVSDRATEPEQKKEERHAGDVTELKEMLEQGIRVANAGQVLAAPYLPRLFGILDLVRDGAFRSSEAQERAVHLLQFMVDGSSDTAEYELVLNKLLCGLDPGTPINRGIVVAAAEQEAIDGLLRGMIENWQALKNTSVNGFRESFLQRQGRLRLDSDVWRLSVDPKAFDMLLDRIPWSFSIVKHAWMKEVIYVDWR